MVARRPGLDPPRAREVAGEHAADRLPPRLAAQDGAIVGGLEGQLLPALGELGLDLRQRRARRRRHHQLLGLVHGDAGKAGELQPMRRLDRPPEPALAAVADHLQLLLLAHRPGDEGRQLVGAGRAIGRGLSHGRLHPAAA